MPDYKSMYFKLLRAQNKAVQVLIQAAQEAEEQVLCSKSTEELLHVWHEKQALQGETVADREALPDV